MLEHIVTLGVLQSGCLRRFPLFWLIVCFVFTVLGFLLVCFVLFGDRFSVYLSDLIRTCYLDQTNLELTKIHLPLSEGLEACPTTPGLSYFFVLLLWPNPWQESREERFVLTDIWIQCRMDTLNLDTMDSSLRPKGIVVEMTVATIGVRGCSFTSGCISKHWGVRRQGWPRNPKVCR